MKILLPLSLTVLSITGCSIHKTSVAKEEEYCSPRSLKHLESPTTDKKVEEQVAQGVVDQKAQKLQEIFSIANKEGKACFQELLAKQLIKSSNQQVCVVLSTNDKGALSFLDVEDNINPLTPAFKECLVNIFGKVNYSEVPSVTVKQMIRFRIK